MLGGRGPVFNVAIWESMVEQTHCARVRKHPQSVRNASTSVRKLFQAFAPSPSSYRCCRFGTVVAAPRVKGAFCHGAWGQAGRGSVAASWRVKSPLVPTVTGLLQLGVAILATLSAIGESQSRPCCALKVTGMRSLGVAIMATVATFEASCLHLM